MRHQEYESLINTVRTPATHRQLDAGSLGPRLAVSVKIVTALHQDHNTAISHM